MEEAHVSVAIFVQAVSVFRHCVVQQLDSNYDQIDVFLGLYRNVSLTYMVMGYGTELDPFVVLING